MGGLPDSMLGPHSPIKIWLDPVMLLTYVHGRCAGSLLPDVVTKLDVQAKARQFCSQDQ